MKSILVNKRIGDSWWEEGITAKYMRNELEQYDQGDNKVQIVIDSPGGSVWECISIFNVIRNFMRAHKEVTVETYIQGMAASSASIIALAAKIENPDSKIIVEDNSVYMIHNAWSSVMGNHLELEKEAGLLVSIDNLMAKYYTQVSGKEDKEVHSLMDAETFFFGSEIVDAGFADEVIKSGSAVDNTDKAALFNNAKMSVEKTRKETKIVDEADYKEIAASLEGAKNILAASLDKTVKMEHGASHNAPENNAGVPVNNNMEEVVMTLDELKAKEPALYAQVFALGKDEGSKEERARCDAHLKMGEIAGCLDVAAGFIRDGSAVADNNVQTTYFEKRIANAENTARKEDNPADVATPAASTSEKEDAMMAAFDKAVLGGR
jgi:ATP-dependent protease ClpP protease subunit